MASAFCESVNHRVNIHQINTAYGWRRIVRSVRKFLFANRLISDFMKRERRVQQFIRSRIIPSSAVEAVAGVDLPPPSPTVFREGHRFAVVEDQDRPDRLALVIQPPSVLPSVSATISQVCRSGILVFFEVSFATNELLHLFRSAFLLPHNHLIPGTAINSPIDGRPHQYLYIFEQNSATVVVHGLFHFPIEQNTGSYACT